MFINISLWVKQYIAWIKKFIWPIVMAGIVAYFVLTPESKEGALQSSAKSQIDLFEYNIPFNLRTGKYKEMETYWHSWGIGDMTKKSQKPYFNTNGANFGMERVNENTYISYQWYKGTSIEKRHFSLWEVKDDVTDLKWYKDERKEKLMEHQLENRYVSVGEEIEIEDILVSPYGKMPPCKLEAHYDKLNLYDIDIKYPDIENRKMKDILSSNIKKQMGNDLIYEDVIVASCDNGMGTVTENYLSQSLGLFAIYAYPTQKNKNPHTSFTYTDKQQVSFR